jgi:hypothetical protein
MRKAEIGFARNGGAKLEELETFQRCTNTLKRVIAVLGIHHGRIARDVSSPSLGDILREDLRRQRKESPP